MDKKLYTIGDLLFDVANLVKKFENNLIIQEEINKNDNPLYSINEVMEIYPKLSKYTITKSINDGHLPVTRIGNHRYFYKNDIENILKAKSERLTKINDDSTWRNHE